MNKKLLAILLCCAFLFVGCASTGTDTGTSEPMKKSTKGAIAGTAAGAAVGALVGQAFGHSTPATLIGAAIGAAVGGGAGYAVGHMMDKQEKDMRAALEKSDAATVSREGDLLSVALKGDVTFKFDSAEVRPELASELKDVAGVIKQYPDTVILIEGHTDSVGTDSYNLDLSNRRATSVKNVLIQNGVASNRLETVGYGKTRPIASNDTADGRSKNRRVEIKIAPKVDEPKK